MSAGVSLRSVRMLLLQLVMFVAGFQDCLSSPLEHLKGYMLTDGVAGAFLPEITPSASPQPFLPLLAPSPLSPFTNSSVPKLSGLCMLNFTAAQSLMSMTAIDCWAAFAPLLANVICCPQLHATLVILVGQSSKDSGALALNRTLAEPCLSDIEQVLAGQGAGDNLKQVCSIHPSNLTEASCPVKDVDEFESIVNSSELLASCGKIDPVKECCDQVCQGAILEAARKLALKASDPLSMDGSHVLPEHSTRVNDCRTVVLRWLASNLDPYQAKEVLRGLTNCNVNKVCPLVFPNMKHVANSCGNGISNQTACCDAMDSYISHLQKQTLITNLQALDCATSLGLKLQKYNITRNVYSLCHISLKDFSLQVGSQVSGCLLPSLPSDATFDKFSGISFICDLNDNIPAQWPSLSQLPASSCNKTVRIPALPAATNAQSGLYNEYSAIYLLIASSMTLPVELTLLPILEKLYLDNDKLSVLPPELRACGTETVCQAGGIISLEHNKLDRPLLDFRAMAKLQILRLFGNPLEFLHGYLAITQASSLMENSSYLGASGYELSAFSPSDSVFLSCHHPLLASTPAKIVMQDQRNHVVIGEDENAVRLLIIMISSDNCHVSHAPEELVSMLLVVVTLAFVSDTVAQKMLIKDDLRSLQMLCAHKNPELLRFALFADGYLAFCQENRSILVTFESLRELFMSLMVTLEPCLNKAEAHSSAILGENENLRCAIKGRQIPKQGLRILSMDGGGIGMLAVRLAKPKLKLTETTPPLLLITSWRWKKQTRRAVGEEAGGWTLAVEAFH
ncbi:hypothetical protein COLO4_31763 [Corchorus olitorius]|uniref:Uncharacterized protein n=1 Tax=Corchorus olitorius TaxID=93759 RepID=A0A1R3H3B9_9ROSI|nr:hypothetical protein COLO4_31763 [Corchorus olitorius]